MRFNRPRVEHVLRNSPSAVNQHFAGWPPPDKFYKRKSQEKHFANDRIFSDFPARLNERGWFWSSAPWTRFSAQPGAAVWIFSPCGFHRVVATKPVHSETDKQNGCWVPTMVLTYRSWAIRVLGSAPRETELRQAHKSTPDGAVGNFCSIPADIAILESLQENTEIQRGLRN
jgi:hypothetical protein